MKIILAIVILILFILVVWYVRCQRRPTLGIVNDKLLDCPNSPNCVNSQSNDPLHQIEPLVWNGKGNPRIILKKILLSMPRSEIVEQSDSYLHAEYRSKIFRFIDDVEFYFPPNSKIIHVRSAARCGYGDFGVNRKRVEEIHSKFIEAQK